MQTQCWLNVEQSGGQERNPKQKLRKDFRNTRDILQNIAALNQKDWGNAHILRLSEFLRAALHTCTSTAEFWKSAWAAYYPIGSELQLLGHCPMDECWLPHALGDGSLHWYRWQEGIEAWDKDKRSLPQPPASVQLNLNLPSTPSPLLVMTPCLAVDRSGTRLGYGGGYYDRFLAENRNHVLSVACVPQELYLPENTLPKEPHDVCVDVIVTENSVEVISVENFEIFLEKNLGGHAKSKVE